MRTKKFERAEKARSLKFYIDEIIEEERAKERKNIMPTHFSSVKIRMMHNDTQVNIEFDLMEVTTKEVKEALRELFENGFVKPIGNSNATKPDNAGKIGVVTSVTKKDGKEQWEVIVKLDDVGAGEQKIISFSAKEYRKGDVVRIEKNAKGYAVGVILEDSERPTKTDDIPF